MSTSDAAGLPLPTELPLDDELVDRLLVIREGQTFETKRAGENRRKIETVVAFANTEGGLLVLGIEDEEKATGRDRLYGVEENPEAIDELRHLLGHRVTPAVGPPVAEPVRFIPIGCTLRDGSRGSVMIVQVPKSAGVHSVVAGSTYVRYDKSNRPISASEIVELSMRRGTTSAVTALVDVPFDLLDTEHWRAYAAQRQLTRRVAEAMRHLGLAREEAGQLRPTRAAVLLFAEEPSGLLDSKCTIRVFHYKGEAVERSVHTNLVRPPRTVGGPLIRQIRAARDVIVDELATGVQVGPLGFEIAQRYPVRVIQEAITNAVIHRDYRLSADIHVRIFSDRIEIQSPGVLPGGVTIDTIGTVGSRPRNRMLVDHLREFPIPPNLDAGEGVPMMQQTMEAASLYDPTYSVDDAREAVTVQLFNEERPGVWTQVVAHLASHGTIGNAEIRALLRTDDSVRVSRLLRSWVDLGLLVVVDPTVAKQYRRYRRPTESPLRTLFSQTLENIQGRVGK